jgi:Methyltransferase domain
MASAAATVARKAKRVKAGIRRRKQRWDLVGSLPRHGVGAEVGTWKGDFSAQLLRRAEPRRLYLVDPWEYRDDPQYEHAMFGDRTPGGQQRMDAIHAGVCDRFGREIGAGRVVVARARSTDAAATLEPLDWVYIDGDHTYAGVRDDLEAFYPLIKPGGVFAGDDYGMVGWWEDGVKRAVDEFVAAHGCALTVTGNQFRFTKPS